MKALLWFVLAGPLAAVAAVPRTRRPVRGSSASRTSRSA